MTGFGNIKKTKKERHKVNTYTVPYESIKSNDGISISTNRTTKFSIEKLLSKAFQFHSQGNISEAAKYYQYCLDKGCSNVQVFMNYGAISVQLGNVDLAGSLFKKSVELFPENKICYYNYGEFLLGQKKLSEAELFNRKAIELDPSYVSAYSNLGKALLDQGKLIKAEKIFRKAIELDSENVNSNLNLAKLMIDNSEFKEAEILLRKVIQINPKNRLAHLNLGAILNELGKPNESEIHTREAIKINPLDSEAFVNLGQLYEQKGQTDKALKFFLKAFELDPSSLLTNTMVAQRLYQNGEFESALKYLQNISSDRSKTLYLSCLLILNREKDFQDYYDLISGFDICNADLSAVVEHANLIYVKQNKSSFCNSSMDYIFLDKINEDLFSSEDLYNLISYVNSEESKKRSQAILKNGSQTVGNLFTLDYPFIQSMKKALEHKIALYKDKFKDSEQGFIKNWPKEYQLRAWIISMANGGFLQPHNHEYGWITGSFYLNVPKSLNDDNSGSISFSYEGPRYPKKNKIFSSVIKNVETRDICIFPSSLFHQTIPFENNEERICFVFDLIQNESDILAAK